LIDVTEFIKKETESENMYQTELAASSNVSRLPICIFFPIINIKCTQDTLQDSGYGTANSKKRPGVPTPPGKENAQPKKARKALASTWSTPGHIPIGHDTSELSFQSFSVETPSKSLGGGESSSVLFSPPSILPDEIMSPDTSVLLAPPDDSGLRLLAAVSPDSRKIPPVTEHLTAMMDGQDTLVS
jgi:hypothetical protein